MYTTETKIEDYLQIDIDDSISDTVTTWIGWVKSYIDNYTNTTFESSLVTKYYDSVGGRELIVDDLTAVTQLDFLDENGDVDDTLTENTDFWLYPLNTTPKNIVKLDSYGSHPIFPVGAKRVKISATFGVADTVPADIEWVATSMVGDIIRQQTNVSKTGKSETLGEYAITYNDIEGFGSSKYKDILSLYRLPVV